MLSRMHMTIFYAILLVGKFLLMHIPIEKCSKSEGLERIYWSMVEYFFSEIKSAISWVRNQRDLKKYYYYYYLKYTVIINLDYDK